VFREQGCEHDASFRWQLPLWQENELHVHDASGPMFAQVFGNTHALQVIVFGEHMVPLVLRVQAVVHDTFVGMHISF
jgi:hypothetical protein